MRSPSGTFLLKSETRSTFDLQRRLRLLLGQESFSYKFATQIFRSGWHNMVIYISKWNKDRVALGQKQTSSTLNFFQKFFRSELHVEWETPHHCHVDEEKRVETFIPFLSSWGSVSDSKDLNITDVLMKEKHFIYQKTTKHNTKKRKSVGFSTTFPKGSWGLPQVVGR